ncbi:UNVERIFIED_ORG: hypothetical protein FHR35_006300 [Microbispora rosea subsp. rosea]
MLIPARTRGSFGIVSAALAPPKDVPAIAILDTSISEAPFHLACGPVS